MIVSAHGCPGSDWMSPICHGRPPEGSVSISRRSSSASSRSAPGRTLRPRGRACTVSLKPVGMVTLYHRPTDGWDPAMTPPRRIEIGSPSLRWRVTDPDAPVDSLQPAHPLLARPNHIGLRDWSGWDKERGLYFASSWNEAYAPLLGMSDQGESLSRRSDFRRDRQGPSYSCEPRAPSSTRQARSRGLPAHRQFRAACLRPNREHPIGYRLGTSGWGVGWITGLRGSGTCSGTGDGMLGGSSG